MQITDILQYLKSPTKKEVELITKAYNFAKESHESQKRLSGEPYFIHSFETAKTLASLSLDAETISAGLLHDVLEDTEITTKIIKKEFGERILFLIESVTKLGEIKYKGSKEQAENLRRLMLAMAHDIKVVFIKLADRLHNIKTLHHLQPSKQKRIALETLEIYAPLAGRLGIGFFKDELENLTFPYVYPKEHALVKQILQKRIKKSEKNLSLAKHTIDLELEKNKIRPVNTHKRIKRPWSFHKKLLKNEMDPEKIYDLEAIRIILSSVEECYQVLGIIHNIWKPLPGRMKDYIAIPKPNGYQSLHTVVFTEQGNIIELQIRTELMHQEAEYGIAAHWIYKEKGTPKKKWVHNQNTQWINQLIEWQKEISDSRDFIKNIKLDFFNDRVFLFTPKGDVIDLPEGATAIDFAYSVHSDVGNKAIGAKINGRFTNLGQSLKNGDIVEIKTQKNKKPSAGWLKSAKTTLAKRQIKKHTKTKW